MNDSTKRPATRNGREGLPEAGAHDAAPFLKERSPLGAPAGGNCNAGPSFTKAKRKTRQPTLINQGRTGLTWAGPLNESVAYCGTAGTV